MKVADKIRKGMKNGLIGLAIAGAGLMSSGEAQAVERPADVTWYEMTLSPGNLEWRGQNYSIDRTIGQSEIDTALTFFRNTYNTPYDTTTTTTPGLSVKFNPGTYTSNVERQLTTFPVMFEGTSNSPEDVLLNMTLGNMYNTSWETDNPYFEGRNFTWDRGPRYNETISSQGDALLENVIFKNMAVLNSSPAFNVLVDNCDFVPSEYIPAMEIQWTDPSLIPNKKSLKSSGSGLIVTNNTFDARWVFRNSGIVNAGQQGVMNGNNAFYDPMTIIRNVAPGQVSDIDAYMVGNLITTKMQEEPQLKSANLKSAGFVGASTSSSANYLYDTQTGAIHRALNDAEVAQLIDGGGNIVVSNSLTTDPTGRMIPYQMPEEPEPWRPLTNEEIYEMLGGTDPEMRDLSSMEVPFFK